jgi:hypothetical protein
VRKEGDFPNAQWTRAVVDDRTLPDDYHTQPSVGVDQRGGVHIAYNMHNMPWQYLRSRTPCSVADLEFLGRSVTDHDLRSVFEENRTPFPENGSAPIPGNQVTYPAFFNDRNGMLYVTYRFAVRPARPWLERAFGAGIANFDAIENRWHAIGGEVPLTSLDATVTAGAKASAFPFAWNPGWTVYPPRLWFDRNNALYVIWLWRQTQAGIDTTHPSFATRATPSKPFARADGTTYSLPISIGDVGLIDAFAPEHQFHASASVTTDLNGDPWVVLGSADVPRALVVYDKTAKHWRASGPTPYGASAVICEDDGVCWAYASGPTVFRRVAGDGQWRMVHQEKGYCDPKPLHMLSEHRRFLHVTRCDQRAAKIYEIVDATEAQHR